MMSVIYYILCLNLKNGAENMKICGLQKLSLLDFPGKLSAIVFTGGCNLRCPFCHNSSLVFPGEAEEIMSSEELISFLKKRQGKLEGVCITGGEPLLQPDLEELIRDIRNLGYAVKLDTNGSNPEKLEYLINSGLLDYVAMDIKNSLKKYPETCGIEGMNTDSIRKSIDILMQNRVPFEFRTTVVNEFHTVEDIQDIVCLIKGAPRYYLQNFIDSGAVLVDGLTAVSPEIMLKMRDVAAEYVENAEIRGQ